MSIKLVDGQLDFWKLTSEFSEISHSLASNLFRDYIKAVETTQAIAPDVVPSTVNVHPMIESDTGKLVTAIS